MGIDDANLAFAAFIEIVLNCLNMSCPFVFKRIHKKPKYRSSGWLSSSLREESKRLRNLYGFVTRMGSTELLENYGIAVRQHKRAIRTEKKQIIRKKIFKANNSTREI